MTPPLTPLEADAAIRASRREPLVVCGWTFTMDGPMMCPWEHMAPVATPPGYTPGEDTEFYCSGEPGDPITSETAWQMV